MEITRLLAEHISTIKFEDLPADVIKSAKQHILDGIGNQIAASAISEPAKTILKLLKQWEGAQESTVVGYGYRLPSPSAALVNAMLGHGVELDDAHGKALTKAGSSLIPTIMAIGEAASADVNPFPSGQHDVHYLDLRQFLEYSPGFVGRIRSPA